MKRLTLSFGLATLVCLPMARDTPSNQATNAITYTFMAVNYPGDVFTQLLGINDSGGIAGTTGVG